MNMSVGSEQTEQAKSPDRGLRTAVYTLAMILVFLAGCWTTHLFCERPIIVEPPAVKPEPEPKPRPWRKEEVGDRRSEVK
jgi:hypothetical protein